MPSKSLLLIAFIISSFCSIYSYGQRPTPSPAPEFNQCWEYSDKENSFENLLVTKDRIIAASPVARLIALDPTQGSLIWTADLGGEIISSIESTEQKLFVATHAKSDAVEEQNYLNSISLETGITLWRIKIGGTGKIYVAATPTSVIAAAESGEIAGYRADNGTLLWQFRVEGGVTAPIYHFDGKALIAGGSGRASIVNAETGEAGASDKLTTVAKAVYFDDLGLVIGDARGEITALKSAKRVWRLRGGGQIAAITALNSGTLGISSYDNFIYILARVNGHIIWKKRMAGRAVGVLDLGNGNLLLADSEGGPEKIVSIENGRTISQIKLPDQPNGLNLATKYFGTLALTANGSVYGFRSGECK